MNDLITEHSTITLIWNEFRITLKLDIYLIYFLYKLNIEIKIMDSGPD